MTFILWLHTQIRIIRAEAGECYLNQNTQELWAFVRDNYLPKDNTFNDLYDLVWGD